MNAHLQRGILLHQQRRYEQAEPELRQATVVDPQDAYTRALLALNLCEQGRYDEADSEVAEGLQLNPSLSFLHYVRAYIGHNRGHDGEALRAIREAIQLDPDDADYRALQAQILLDQRDWQEALDAANSGLQLDPEHVGCTNLRAIALVKLGRNSEAGQTIDRALAKNPENAITHANQGWTLLHTGQHAKALEHFREALRLDPENEWARQGTIEALRARNFIYALLLRYFLWMSRLSGRMQWAVILGGAFGMRFLWAASNADARLAPYILVIQILYLLFVFFTWTAQPVFNLLLRLNKFGRMVLNREEIFASNCVGALLGLAILSLIVGLTLFQPALIGALVFGFSILPVAGVFKFREGQSRRIMIACTVIVVGSGILSFILFILTMSGPLFATDSLKQPRDGLLGIFGFGLIGSTLLMNILISRRVER